MAKTTRPNAARRRRIRAALAARDGASCFYCAHPLAELTEATLDHLIPYSVLPTWRQANLVLACRPCNQAKADRLPQEFLRPAHFAPRLIPVPAPVSHFEARPVSQIGSDQARRVCAVRRGGKPRGNRVRLGCRNLAARVTVLTTTYASSRSVGAS